jgi:hypothetical protein
MWNGINVALRCGIKHRVRGLEKWPQIGVCVCGMERIAGLIGTTINCLQSQHSDRQNAQYCSLDIYNITLHVQCDIIIQIF